MINFYVNIVKKKHTTNAQYHETYNHIFDIFSSMNRCLR